MSTVNIGNSTNNPVPVNVNAALPAGANTIGNINIAAINAGLADTSAALSGMTSLNATTQIALLGTTSASVLLSGSWSATVLPEISVDGGTTWLATQFYRPDTQALVASVTANGTYNIVGTAGASHVRVRVSAFTSGTVTGTLRATTQAPDAVAAQIVAALPTGANVIGALSSNQTINLNQVAGSAIATAASGIAKVGLTDGTGNAITSTSNAIDVNIKSGGGSGFSVVDETAWTAGTSAMVPAGGVFNDSAAALTSGQEGTVRVTTNRAVHVNLRDASANQLLGSKTSANSLPVVIASDQGSYTVSTQPADAVDAGNSSTANLGSNAVFTGTGTSSLGFSAISVEAFANQASAASGLSIQQSQDNSNWDIADTFSVSASTAFQTTVALVGQYYRVVYTNGGSAQTTFRLQTVKLAMESPLPRTLSALGNAKTSLADVGGSAVSLGQTTMAASLPVTMASNQGNINVAVNAALPTGANTIGAVTQASGPWSTNVTQVGGSSLALGQAAMASSVPVVLASNQSAVSVSLPANNSTMIGVTSPGGISASAIAAAATNTVVKSGAGRLCRVMVTTAGTAALTFYDNATGGSTSGNILGYIPANAAAGSVYDFQFVASTGIQAPGGSNTPAVTVGYI